MCQSIKRSRRWLPRSTIFGTAAKPARSTRQVEARLQDISVQLDRFYDLLHQRRGLIDAGSDPNKAQLRDAKIVEGYVE